MLLRAFAKINLDLRILGKRPDGYHELQTELQTIDWFDEIHIDRASGFQFSATDGPTDKTNLVVRAVRAFEQATGVRADVKIELIKNIPSGAGLGGGSADAAVTFLGLQRVFETNVPESEALHALRSIGSDVPFFLFGGRACGTGRGDVIYPVEDRSDYRLVLVNPGVSIVTAEAYSWLTVHDKSNSIEGFRAECVPGSDQAEANNDFELPVFARYPQLKAIRDKLLRLGAFRAALSGSGSVVYGQFRTEEAARITASELGRSYSVKLTKPLSRADYHRRMMD